MTSSLTDQKTFSDYELVKLKEVDQSYFKDQPQLLPMGDSQEQALEILCNVFNITNEQPNRILPVYGLKILVSKAHLIHIVEKRANGRERFGLFAYQTLLNPYEVWRTQYEENIYRYVYIGLFKNSKYHIAVIVNIFPDGNILWNYINGELRSIEKLRKGILEYNAEK